MSLSRVELLRSVDFLADLDDEALGDLAARARTRRYARGQRIVSELEFGTDLFVLLDGEAEVSVQPRIGEHQSLGTIGPGAAVGEMASLTGQLRSATVTAVRDATVLVIADSDFDRLRERRPEIALSLVRTLSLRLGEAERTIDGLLAEGRPTVPKKTLPLKRGSLVALWRELVVRRQKDLAFLTLAAFTVTLLVVRAAVFVAFTYRLAPREVLRAAYTSGFGLLVMSALCALMTFRPGLRRVIAVAYGIGAALIVNELGVTLAFDIFFKDIHTPDPTLAFDIERLYRRTEPLRAIAVGLAVLFQAAYLRRFYARAWFVLRTRARRLL